MIMAIYHLEAKNVPNGISNRSVRSKKIVDGSGDYRSPS